MKERWAKLSIAPNHEVSSQGRVRNAITKHVLALRTMPTGYITVKVRNEIFEKKTFRVHRLVAMAFLGQGDNKDQVDHINRIRHDNRLENLRWSSKKKNEENKVTHADYVHIIIEMTNQGVKEEDIVDYVKNRKWPHVKK